MNNFKVICKELHSFLILWSTQSFSLLGSSMTSFALILWTYQSKGSALTTALLSVCSYAPYVVMSIFAGALSDKWNKKLTMLASDSFAAVCTVGVLLLLKAGRLEIWHLYCLNALSGLMGTVQQPAGDVAVSLLVPEKHYQRVSGLRSFSNSLVNILTPAAATTLYTVFGLDAVIYFDLTTFVCAFAALALWVRIPERREGADLEKTLTSGDRPDGEPLIAAAKAGLSYLWENRGILHLILFLAAINLTASMYNAAFPAMLLSRDGGGETALAAVNTATGLAMVAGSIAASLLPAPKSRIRVICNTLLLSMSTENFILAFGSSASVWCLGGVLGWIWIPIMNANMDVVLRTHIPVHMQGRVYSARNTLQFFTIPVGYLLGGVLVDQVFEPFMAGQSPSGLLCGLFGSGKGSGAALFFLVIGVLGVATCIVFRRDRHIWKLEE